MTHTLRGWLDERAAGVPAALLERIEAVIENVGDAVALDQSVRALSRAVTVHLDQTRMRECTERREALDLLTTDALVTYVLELAAVLTPEMLDRQASELMRMIVGPASALTPPLA